MLEQVLKAHRAKVAGFMEDVSEEVITEEEPPSVSTHNPQPHTPFDEAPNDLVDEMVETLADLKIQNAQLEDKKGVDAAANECGEGNLVVKAPIEDGSDSALLNHSSVVGDELSDDLALEAGMIVEGEEQ